MQQVITTDAAAPASAPANRAAATARTRANILAAASRLFVERGFGAVSMRDIAAEAGLSHPGVIRHFASKDEILEAVVEDFTALTQAGVELQLGPDGDGLRTYGEVARRNAAIDGYIPLFTTLAGEATSVAHPAHAHFRERHVELRTRSSVLFRAAIDDGELPPGTDVDGETIRLAAAWDGLQLISLYLPELVDIPAMLDRHLDRLRGADVASGPADATAAAASALSPSAPGAGAFGLVLEAEPDTGYAPGRARRTQIVADASTLFARRGFHATSLREIAEQVGIGKSTLLHHFSSKDDLLSAVVAHRDSAIDARVALDTDGSPAAFLRDIPGHARHNGEHEPGLIEVYAVLSAEAAAASHPAHEYFRRRFESAIAQFADLFARAAAEAGRGSIDAAFEAVWFVALWDGLQLQWLYDPETVDVGDHLEAHLARVMPVE